MRIYEIISESDELYEGPILNKIGRGIGNVVGTAAKGVGALAGGAVGIGSALRKGYRAGKDVVARGGDLDQYQTTAQPRTTSAVPQASGTAPQVQRTTSQSPAGTNTEPEQDSTQAPPTPAAPKSQEQIRKEKQAAAAQVAQAELSANPAPPEEPAPAAPAAPKTPEQIRKEKQAAAQAKIDASLAAPPEEPATAPKKSKEPKVGVPQGRAAVDQAVDFVKTVRGDRRPEVVQYAQAKFADIKEEMRFYSNFLGKDL